MMNPIPSKAYLPTCLLYRPGASLRLPSQTKHRAGSMATFIEARAELARLALRHDGE